MRQISWLYIKRLRRPFYVFIRLKRCRREWRTVCAALRIRCIDLWRQGLKTNVTSRCRRRAESLGRKLGSSLTLLKKNRKIDWICSRCSKFSCFYVALRRFPCYRLSLLPVYVIKFSGLSRFVTSIHCCFSLSAWRVFILTSGESFLFRSDE